MTSEERGLFEAPDIVFVMPIFLRILVPGSLILLIWVVIYCWSGVGWLLRILLLAINVVGIVACAHTFAYRVVFSGTTISWRSALWIVKARSYFDIVDVRVGAGGRSILYFSEWAGLSFWQKLADHLLREAGMSRARLELYPSIDAGEYVAEVERRKSRLRHATSDVRTIEPS